MNLLYIYTIEEQTKNLIKIVDIILKLFSFATFIGEYFCELKFVLEKE